MGARFEEAMKLLRELVGLIRDIRDELRNRDASHT
jgi:hypothetical protein